MLSAITAGQALAQGEQPVSLDWSAPDGCPTASDVRAQALRLLAGPPIPAERNVVAVARVTRAETGRWRVDISMSSASAQGKRSLDADTCSGLAEATALIVAIMVDPDRASVAASRPSASANVSSAVASSSSAAPAAPVLSAPPPPVPSRDRPVRARSAGATPRWGASARSLVDIGTLPDTAVGVGVGLAAVVGHLRSDVALNVFPGRTYTFPSAGGAGADMSAWSAAGDFAYVTRLGPSQLALGGGAEVTYLSAMGVKGAAPFAPRSGSLVWPALRADAALTIPTVGPVFLRLEAVALAPLRRPTVDIDPIGVVHQPSTLAGRLGVGVEVEF
jgi:hypothetical protein